ncbi:ABC transporter permease [soil metagenome]
MFRPDPAVVLVAGREIREATRSKALKITLGLSVIAVAAVIVISHLASGGSGSAAATPIGFVTGTETPTDPDRLVEVTRRIGDDITVQDFDDDDTALAALEDGTVDAVILGDARAIVTAEPLDGGDDSDLARTVAVIADDLALRAGLVDAGIPTADLYTATRHPPPPLESLGPAADDATNSGRIGAAIATNVLLFLMLQTYGSWVISGVTREKSSRVVEVLLASVHPRRLLFGKILGIGTIAMVHAATLVVTALVTARIVGLRLTEGFGPVDIALSAVWFLIGYALYCSACAAAGSLCARAEDAQGASVPIFLPLLIGYIVGFTATAGATPVLWVLAFIPPTAVLCMPVLAATGAAPWWAAAISMVITLIFAYGVARLAARIYQRSILRSGKRVSWRDAITGRTRQRDQLDQPAPAT